MIAFELATRVFAEVLHNGGDDSIGAPGLWIENGQFDGPVMELTVALHLNDLLRNSSAVGNDLCFVPSGGVICAPTVHINRVTIGGR